MNIPKNPIPQHGLLVTHFFTVTDQEKSKGFYVDILGGELVAETNPTVIKLSNSWIIINEGGGPTPDKPGVTLETPTSGRVFNSFLNLRVADIDDCYRDWKLKGAEFITPPIDNEGWEMRCYLRDPDGYIIEVGQAGKRMIDLFL